MLTSGVATVFTSCRLDLLPAQFLERYKFDSLGMFIARFLSLQRLSRGGSHLFHLLGHCHIISRDQHDL